MKIDNFLRNFSVNEINYVAVVRPSQYKIVHGEPQFFIQVWKMNTPKSGTLYQPALSEWRLPSVQGYAIRTWDLDIEYSRFIEDFKEYEKKKSGKPVPKSFRY